MIYRDELNEWLAIHHIVTILWGAAAIAMIFETFDLVIHYWRYLCLSIGLSHDSRAWLHFSSPRCFQP